MTTFDRRLERLEGRQGRRPDSTMTDAQIQREHESLDREIEHLLAEMVRRGFADEAARILAEVEADARKRGLAPL